MTGVAAGLMQGQGPLQSGCKGGICGHSASTFGNSVSMPIAALSLSGHYNGYRATVAVICNISYLLEEVYLFLPHILYLSILALRDQHIERGR